MNRLLQGDVGQRQNAGSAAAIWACIRAGYQAALLAPTETLAAQHAEGLNRLLALRDAGGPADQRHESRCPPTTHWPLSAMTKPTLGWAPTPLMSEEVEFAPAGSGGH